ncbi:hypothetical protein [Microvirga brassicacearum]|uniref:Uncharacterized protein n=1 Tax=Microvirga brassicacearum TaxID=2580413 RepID=A0A5N3PHM9_9HYPH|nr:hypothetical protein [Microvirga brassicacearum]KAB0269251.1 hypothetical protein FEZ63_03915 [Microvirga brassicacearum]
MPTSQNPIVEWPRELYGLLEGMQIATGRDDKRYCRMDVDVDPNILFLLNDFEARVRHRQVRVRPSGCAECLVSEMNGLVGLGAASDPTRHIGKVRISFHDIQDDSCVDAAPQM